MNRKVSFEQCFGLTQKYRQNNIGEVLISIATASVEEAMFAADNDMRQKSILIAEELQNAGHAFQNKKYVDCIYYIGEVNLTIRTMIDIGKDYIASIDKQSLLSKNENEVFIKKEASSAVVNFFKWIYDGIFGKPLEDAYNAQVDKTVDIIVATLGVVRRVAKEVDDILAKLKIEKDRKNVDGWIQHFNQLKSISDRFSYNFSLVLDHHDIQKLLAASDGKLQTHTGEPPSNDPQHVQSLIEEMPAAQQARRDIERSEPNRSVIKDPAPEQRWTSKYQFYVNGKMIGDARKFCALLKTILDFALVVNEETVIQTSEYGVMGKIIPGKTVELTWDVSKLRTRATADERPTSVEGYKTVIPFEKIKDVIRGIDNDYYNLDQSNLNRIINSPNVSSEEDDGDEDKDEKSKVVEVKEKASEPEPETKPKTESRPESKESLSDIVKKRREEFKIPSERPKGTFGPLGICLTVRASHSPNKEINKERRVLVARYFGLLDRDNVVIGKSDTLAGKMLMIPPYNDPNQYVVIGINPTKEQYKKILEEGAAMKSEAYISSLVRQLKHDRFYNLLKQASDMQDPYLMATIMAKYSATIEESDPELSVQLLMKAKEIVDGK